MLSPDFGYCFDREFHHLSQLWKIQNIGKPIFKHQFSSHGRIRPLTSVSELYKCVCSFFCIFHQGKYYVKLMILMPHLKMSCSSMTLFIVSYLFLFDLGNIFFK